MEDHLAIHLRNRPAELKKAQEDGIKLIGYFPGNYVPEELIHASGAVPLCLAQGGSPSSLDAARSVEPDVLCSFARAQIGERLLKRDPYYSMIDMLVAYPIQIPWGLKNKMRSPKNTRQDDRTTSCD